MNSLALKSNLLHDQKVQEIRINKQCSQFLKDKKLQ